jgi:hypothetical protein
MTAMHLHLKAAFVTDLAALGAVVYAITFTATDITSMMVAITALITAIGIAAVNIIAARATLRKIDTATGKIDEVHAQGKIIEAQGNSAAATSAAKIIGLESEVRLLRETLAGHNQTTAVLAQSKADVAILKPIADTVEIRTPDKAKE